MADEARHQLLRPSITESRERSREKQEEGGSPACDRGKSRTCCRLGGYRHLGICQLERRGRVAMHTVHADGVTLSLVSVSR